jgi:hypothetical protein
MNFVNTKLFIGLILKSNQKWWMAEELMAERQREFWDRRPGTVLKKRGMLVLDTFNGQLTEKVGPSNLYCKHTNTC